MDFRDLTPEDKEIYNKFVTHPLQSYEWGTFREISGLKVIRRGLFEKKKLVEAFQLTLHPVPRTPYTIGYLPKGTIPSKEMLNELRKIGKQHNCIFIQLEPNSIVKKTSQKNPDEKITKSENFSTLNSQLSTQGLRPSAHPLFTKYTFLLDLTQSEDVLLANMHQKCRYNIKIANKHGVKVSEDNSDKAFARYWELTEETTKRQKFYAHTKRYHELQWQTFPHPMMKKTKETNDLTSHLITASYEGKVLTTLLFFAFGDTLYYPYGASSSEHRNVMHSQLAMWEGIRLGKQMGLKKFDMWGAMGPDPDQNDPWFGFHNFKQRFGPDHIEFIGSYDLVINTLLYQGYKIADKLRWLYLKMKK